MISFVILLLLIAVLVMRHSYHKNVALQYQFRFLALGDKLKMGAIEGRIDQESESYRFLDRAISNLARKTSRLTLWSIAAFRILNTLKKSQEPYYTLVEIEIYGNQFALEVYKELGGQLVQCTLDKHKFSILTILAALHPMFGLARIYSRLKLTTENQVLDFQNRTYFTFVK